MRLGYRFTPKPSYFLLLLRTVAWAPKYDVSSRKRTFSAGILIMHDVVQYNRTDKAGQWIVIWIVRKNRCPAEYIDKPWNTGAG